MAMLYPINPTFVNITTIAMMVAQGAKTPHSHVLLVVVASEAAGRAHSFRYEILLRHNADHSKWSRALKDCEAPLVSYAESALLS